MTERTYTKDEKYRPVVTVKKVKNELPTVVEIRGRKYILEHVDQYKRQGTPTKG